MLRVLVISLVALFVFARQFHQNSFVEQAIKNKLQSEQGKHGKMAIYFASPITYATFLPYKDRQGEEQYKEKDEPPVLNFFTTHIFYENQKGDVVGSTMASPLVRISATAVPADTFQVCLNSHCSNETEACGLGCIYQLNFCNQKIKDGIQAYNHCVKEKDQASALIQCVKLFCGSI